MSDLPSRNWGLGRIYSVDRHPYEKDAEEEGRFIDYLGKNLNKLHFTPRIAGKDVAIYIFGKWVDSCVTRLYLAVHILNNVKPYFQYS